MLQYVVKRLFHAVLVVWLAYTVAFATLFILPGDAALRKAGGEDGAASAVVGAERMAEYRAQLGMDRPWYEQYVSFLTNALQGDLGRSIRTGESVTEMYAAALPPTLTLTGSALVLTVLLSAAWAIAAARVPSARLRSLIASVSTLGVAIPSFFLGLVLLRVFSFELGLLPAFGSKGFASLILPSVVLAVAASASLGQVLLNSIGDTDREGFTDMARARGAGEWYVLLRHNLRNSTLPVVTMLGMVVGSLIGGSVVVEMVFSRDGVGRILVDAVDYQDTPVVLAAVSFAAVGYAVTSLAVDLVYPLIDHRVDVRADVVSR